MSGDNLAQLLNAASLRQRAEQTERGPGRAPIGKHLVAVGVVFVVLDHERQPRDRPRTVSLLRAVEIAPRSLHMCVRLAAT